MILDARDLPLSEREIDADLCIVGAGPAGLVISTELASSGARIVLLESGAGDFDPWTQELNAGHVDGTSYGDLRTTRARAIGGTATIWNSEIDGQAAAKYVPLDARDFSVRDWLPHSGWPFDAEELRPWYEKAQTLCGLGRFDYGAIGWSTGSAKPLSLDERQVETKVYQFGSAARLLEAPVGHLRASNRANLYVHATVVELVTDARRRRVNAAIFRVRGRQAPVRVNAHTFVLAAGAIENARLMLDSHAAHPGGLGNERGHVGRFFMEHPRDYALTLIPARKTFLEEAGFYDQQGAADGTVIMGRLALNDERSLQASATLLPVASHDSLLARALRPIRDALGSVRARNAAYPRSEASWSRRRRPRRHSPRVRLLLNLEQAPHPDNRVALAAEKDAFGLRRVVLHWSWSDAEQRDLERLRMRFVEALESAGYGTVQIRKDLRPDPNAHHHAGTTRMHVDDRLGVVDAHGRVHSVENLYVTGASVFPTAGFANPTLTIVALAARLAARLGQLAGQSATVCRTESS